MDQYLYGRRLMMVISKFWFESRKIFLLLFAAIGAMLGIWLSLYYTFEHPGLFRPSFQVSYYIIGLGLSGFLSASFLFSELRSKPRALVFLSLPASQLEKFLTTLFFGVFVFWAGYSTVFTAIDWIFVSLNNKRFGLDYPVINVLSLGDYPNPFTDSSSSLLYIYFPLQALFVLGSIYFKTYGFFKTLIVLLVIWFMFFAVPIFIHGFLPPGASVSMFSYEIFDYHGNRLISLPDWFRTSMSFFFKFLITIALWVAAYFRLTERQII